MEGGLSKDEIAHRKVQMIFQAFDSDKSGRLTKVTIISTFSPYSVCFKMRHEAKYKPQEVLLRMTLQADMTKFVKTVNPGVLFTEMQIEAIVGEVHTYSCTCKFSSLLKQRQSIDL